MRGLNPAGCEPLAQMGRPPQRNDAPRNALTRYDEDSTMHTPNLCAESVDYAAIERKPAARLRCWLALLPFFAAASTVLLAAPSRADWVNQGPEGGKVGALAVDPTTPSTVYAGTDGGRLFKTTNGAASWTPTNTGLP